MKSIKNSIPNSITSMNLLCGVASVVLSLSAVSGQPLFPEIGSSYLLPCILIFCGAIFDFFDGFVARLLHVSSEIGKELDSLADLLSFGFAPAGLYALYLKNNYFSELGLLIYLPLLLVLFSALRLAKFNVDKRQTENFIGLTTTATAMFTASLMLWLDTSVGMQIPLWLVSAMVAIFCYLLVSEIPMFSLKIKHWTWKGNELRFILIAVALISIILCGWGGIAITIALYVLFSIFRMFVTRKN